MNIHESSSKKKIHESMPRNTHHSIQRRLHGRPPGRFPSRAGRLLPAQHRVALPGNADLRRCSVPEPGHLGHARPHPQPWPRTDPRRQESISAVQRPTHDGDQTRARTRSWKQQACHRSWRSDRRGNTAGASLVEEESSISDGSGGGDLGAKWAWTDCRT
jgi:hypothetical protein